MIILESSTSRASHCKGSDFPLLQREIWDAQTSWSIRASSIHQEFLIPSQIPPSPV